MKPTNGPVGHLASTDTRLAKALAHPIRVHALRIMSERVASPSDIARELDLPVANVSYHVNTLLRLQCIEEVETRHVRGAIEHMYRAIRRPLVWAEEWKDLPRQARDEATRAWLTTTLADIEQAVNEDTINAIDDRHVSRTPLRLDAQAFTQIAERLSEVLTWAMDLQAEAAVRLADGKTGGPEIDARMLFAYFGRPTESA